MVESSAENKTVLLVTANARYSHASLGLRCLRANLGAYRALSEVLEFTIDDKPEDIVEALLARGPRLVCLSVYIWNSDLLVETARILRRVAPHLLIAAGGPELRFESVTHPIYEWVDLVVSGDGEGVIQSVIGELLTTGSPREKRIVSEPPDLAAVALPYSEYSDEDIAHRVIYVEASRGCPFQCAFCLSARDEKVRRFPEERILEAFDDLYDRGVRRFKFIDRALHLAVSPALLDFFLQKRDPDIFLHFELVPDRLPPRLFDRLSQFPPGAVQVEAGLQTLDPTIAERIGRRQDVAAALGCLGRLRRETGVHIHADLVAGLPGETLEVFRRGFDRLFDLGLHEIQVGILKKLRGAPIARFDSTFEMVYNPSPPYDILQTGCIDYPTMQRLKRFARFFELIANRGRFKSFVPFLIGTASPFDRFWSLSEWLFGQTGRAHGIALSRLVTLLFEYASAVLGLDPSEAANRLYADVSTTGSRSFPGHVADFVTERRRATAIEARGTGLPSRQRRHLA